MIRCCCCLLQPKKKFHAKTKKKQSEPNEQAKNSCFHFCSTDSTEIKKGFAVECDVQFPNELLNLLSSFLMQNAKYLLCLNMQAMCSFIFEAHMLLSVLINCGREEKKHIEQNHGYYSITAIIAVC